MSTVLALSLAALAHLEAPIRVPVEIQNNQVFLNVSVNGSDPFRVVLDTGMPTPHLLLYKSERVDALGLDFGESGMAVGGAGGDGKSFVALLSAPTELAVGDLKLPRVPVLSLPGSGEIRSNHDGIIGDAIFRRFVVRLDVDNRTLELFEPESFSPPENERTGEVPLHFRGGRAFVDMRVAVGAGDPVRAEVVVDLGAGHALSLNDRGTRESGLFSPPARAIETSLGRGLSGEILGQVGRARRVELGRFQFENVVVSFPVTEHQDPGGVDFRDGNLGAEILMRFNVTFDYPRSRMILEPSRRFADPFEHGMTGMIFHVRGPDALVVRRVMKGSPAESAGVQPGDEILGIDGKTLAELGVDAALKALKVDGAKVSLSIRRDGDTQTLHMALRRLV